MKHRMINKSLLERKKIGKYLTSVQTHRGDKHDDRYEPFFY